MPLSSCRLTDLTIEDERALRDVQLYAELKSILVADAYRFRVLPKTLEGRWDRALLLNLTFWGASEGGDVLSQRSIPADVVAHVAWHHLTACALGPGPLSPAGLFLGESIASAFDLYLVGRLLGRRGRSSFLETQVPAMAEAADASGLGPKAFHALLETIASEPAAAFEALRELLFDASMALFKAEGADDALAVLGRFDKHPFAPLLHRYELSNWVLYARAYGAKKKGKAARAIDAELRASAVSLEWLSEHWVAPRLPKAPRKAQSATKTRSTK